MRNGNTWNLNVKSTLAALAGRSILGQASGCSLERGFTLVPAGRPAEDQLVQFRKSEWREEERSSCSNVVETLRLARSCDHVESLALGVLMLAGVAMFGLFLAGRLFGS